MVMDMQQQKRTKSQAAKKCAASQRSHSAPHHFSEQPLFEGLLTALEVLPGIGDILHTLSLGGEVGGAVAQAKLRLRKPKQ